MSRWSFNLQIYFLNKRFKEVVEISQSDENIIQDRTIFEDACIFAPNLHGQGYMSDRDFANYSDLFDTMMSLVKLPDLMIYIRSTVPNLIAQIGKRGRSYEQTIRLDQALVLYAWHGRHHTAHITSLRKRMGWGVFGQQ